MKPNTALRILMIEDNEMDRALIERELKRSDLNYTALCVDNKADFLVELGRFKADVILCDFSLPQFGALEALGLLGERSVNIPFIIVTGTLNDETAVECVKKGATDYVIKDKIVRLPSAIKKALELRKSREEKKEAQERLLQNEQKLKLITNILPAWLTYISKDFKFEFCNKTYDEWFDTEKEIVGRHVKEVLGEEVFQKIELGLRGLVGKGQISFESTLPNQHAVQFVNITLVPDFEKSGDLKGLVCLITDISERKRYEDELKNAKEEADAGSKAKSQFLANMSHEMRTPLAAIAGLLELMVSQNRNPDDKVVWMEKAARNCEHLRKMIDEILDLSKVESGKLEVERSRFAVSAALAQVKSMLDPLAKEKHLELQFGLRGPVPEFVLSDPLKLRHILVNVVGNAIKFSSAGTIRIEIQLDQESNRPALTFLVKDQGPGISMKDAERLFEPFMQADNSMTRKFGGTGLGLAIARKFAQALGGNVLLKESTPGRGSTFSVTIDPGPVNESTQISSLDTMFEQAATPTPTPVTNGNLTGLKVLVVEDAPENQLIVRHFLEMAGVEVDLASDGQEGMKKALSASYDLILMDLQMPVLDGYHATSSLRDKGYKKPIVALTAHALQAEKDKCFKVGFDGFLTKPFKRSDLLDQVSQFKPEASQSLQALRMVK